VGLIKTAGEQNKEIVSTFAVNGMLNVKGTSDDENLMFLLGTGSKAIRTGQGDDMIFIDKTAKMDGIVHVQSGNDTVVLLNRAAGATVITNSDVARVLTLEAPNSNTTLNSTD